MKRQVLGTVMVLMLPAVAAGQTPPPAASTPTIKVGATMFADYTITETPKTPDANGDQVTLSGFNVTRSYINFSGNVTPRISFRITPDIVRNDDGGSLSGNLVFRLKYAYAQMLVGKDAVVKFGVHQTPLIAIQEGLYRYRFQGTSFVEREGGLSSSDTGLSIRKPLPNGYGDVQVGLYNGEGYKRPEVNDQKALMMLASLRPMPNSSVGKGLRLIGYYHADHYVKDAPRTRAAVSVMFEHARFNAGVDLMRRVDQLTVASPEITGEGYSVFVTPFLKEKGRGVEGLIRFDSFDPNTDVAGDRSRLIVGAAYWFPKQGSATAALLAHVEQVRLSGLTATRTSERRFTLNALIAF